MDPSRKNQSTLDKILNSPIAGIAPWIVMALLNGPGRFELSVGLALGIAAIVVILGFVRGASPKMLEFSDVTFFTGLAIVGALASPDTINWLENWAGEIANVALVLIALASIAMKMPFTMQYAREEVDKSLWTNPGFIHVNYVLTWFWAGAFIVGALSGFVGDAFLENSNNLWTGWVIQTGAMIVAIQFTVWYPEYFKGNAARAAGDPNAAPPPISKLFVPLAGYLMPIGVITLIVGGAPTWVGVGLIVIGVALVHRFSRDKKEEQESVVKKGDLPQGQGTADDAKSKAA